MCLWDCDLWPLIWILFVLHLMRNTFHFTEYA